MALPRSKPVGVQGESRVERNEGGVGHDVGQVEVGAKGLGQAVERKVSQLGVLEASADLLGEAQGELQVVGPILF